MGAFRRGARAWEALAWAPEIRWSSQHTPQARAGAPRHLHFQHRIPLGLFGLGSDARLPWCVDIAPNHPIYHDRQGLYDIATTDLVPFFPGEVTVFLTRLYR